MSELSTNLRRTIFLIALFLVQLHVRAETHTPLTLEFWDFPHLPKTTEYLMNAIRRFEADNPGVQVRYTKLPWQDGQQKITLAMLSGQPPDVCGQVSSNLPPFIAQDVLEPLNDYLKPELHDFHASYIDSVSYKGRIYAFPWYKACYVLLLNLDLFERFKVSPPVNGRWSWDEFLEKMQAFTRKPVPGDSRTSGSPAANKDAVYYGLVTNMGPGEYEAYSIIYNFGGRVLQRQGEAVASTVAQPDFVEGLRKLQSLDYEHHVAVPGIGAATQDQSWSQWRDSRTCAATIQGAWCITAVQSANESIERTNERKRAAGRESEMERPIRWMIAAPPTRDGATTPVLASSGLGTYVVFRQKDKRRRDLAAKFALSLISGEGQIVLKHENAYPSRISAGNPFKDNPQLGPVFSLFPEGVLSPLVPGGERIDRVLQQEIQKAVLSDPTGNAPQSTAEQAVKAADRKIRAIIERAVRRFNSNS